MKLLALEGDNPLIETVLEVVDLPEVFPPLEDADFGTPNDAIDLYKKMRGCLVRLLVPLGSTKRYRIPS